METKKFVVIGHRPPPVTGENLCLQYLETELRYLGCTVISKPRADVSNLFLRRASIWLIPGAKPLGHVRDMLLLAWWRLCGCRIEVYIHNISWVYFSRMSWFWRSIAGTKMRFVVLTDKIAASLARHGLSVERLDNTLTQGAEPIEAAASNPYRLVWMSALTEEKGFDVACQIYTALRSKDARWQFDVYGDGPARSLLEQCPTARFNGFVQGDRKEAALKEGGIMLLPSRYRNETQPLVLIEALAHGLPVVSSNVGGIAVIIGDGVNAAGSCLPVQSPLEAWVDAVQSMHDNYARFSSGSRSRYQAIFSRNAFSRKLSGLVESAV